MPSYSWDDAFRLTRYRQHGRPAYDVFNRHIGRTVDPDGAVRLQAIEQLAFSEIALKTLAKLFLREDPFQTQERIAMARSRESQARHWEEILKRHSSSGLSAAAFCRQESISAATLYY